MGAAVQANRAATGDRVFAALSDTDRAHLTRILAQGPSREGRSAVTMRLSILDLAPIAPGQSAADSFAASVALAQQAESLGYQRVWYAEHHNMPTIASSATSVADRPRRRPHRAASGSARAASCCPTTHPLTIAEQFGTLETLHPGRIDLGLGPGARLGPEHAVCVAPQPDDGRPLPGRRPGAAGVPDAATRWCRGSTRRRAAGTNVPLYILGLVDVRRHAGRRARAALCVRLALRAGRAARRRGRLPPRVPAVARSWRSPM